MRSVRLTLTHTHNQVTLRMISDTTTKPHIISHPAPQTHPPPVPTHPATNAPPPPAPLLLAEQHMI